MRVPALLVLACAATLAACGSTKSPLELARERDQAAVDERTAAALARHPRHWVVVQEGAVAAVAPAPDDAVRSARVHAPDTLHRFVYRADDPGPRLYRLAYLPEGGLVAGRRFLADLGFRVAQTSGEGGARSLVLERRGSRRVLDLAAAPRLRVAVQPLGGGEWTELDVPLDPDFDGPLLLAGAAAAAAAAVLDPDRAEIPGKADVQVALGRPFEARRAWAWARTPDLDASAAVEVLVR